MVVEAGEAPPLFVEAPQQVRRHFVRRRRQLIFVEWIRLGMLLLRIRLVQGRRHQDNRPRRLIAADRPQMFEDILQRLIEHADRDDDNMRLVMKRGQVLSRVVAGLIQTARIQECDERGFLGGKVVFA
jgi:hypothetical protein